MELESDCIRAGYIYSLLDYLDKHHGGAGAIFSDAALRPLTEVGLDDRLPISYWEALLATAIEYSGDYELPLKVSAEATPKHWGIGSFVALTSKTIAESSLMLSRVGRLIINASDFFYQFEGDKICVRWMPRENRNNPALVQCTFASWASFLTRYTKLDALDIEVFFNYSCPPCVEAHRRLFGDKIFFSQPHTEVYFPTAYLSLEILYHEPETHSQLLKTSYAQLEALKKQKPQVVAKVYSIVKKSMATGGTNIEFVARSLGVTIRTLQYQLKKHDSSYQKIVDDVRMKHATIYLQDPELTLLDTALLLGFSEQSTFTKWFRRVFGTTPLSYRKEIGKDSDLLYSGTP